jgi:hypothetical protein
MYYYKYLKYKNKYLELLGGVFYDKNGIDTNKWIKIDNNGQHNCGIYINKTDKQLIKCTSGILDIETIIITTDVESIKQYNYIESLQPYFPKIYDINYNQTLNKTFMTMELFDGDITSIFFDILPKIALNKTLDECESILFENDHNIILIDYEKKDLIYRIFKLKIPRTIYKNIRDPYYEFHNYLTDLNKITKSEYNDFIDKLKLLINNFYNFIIIEIMKLLYKITLSGYKYIDYKFDNFAYKLLNDDEINEYNKNHYKCSKKFLNKNLFLYIIDYESGLFKIDNFELVKQEIINFNISSNINGQYRINNIGIHLLYDNEHIYNFTSDIKEIFDTFYNNNTIEQFPIILYEQLNF